MSLYCMARTRRLTLAALEKAEVHARRGDARSQQRRVRDVPPITWVPHHTDADHLALVERYKEHVEGAFIPRAKSKVLHLLVKFPEAVPVATTEDAERALAVAVKFATSVFGDEAVFAARMDRDEKSLTNADLFIAPRYLKKTKNAEKIAISLSRHLKIMAEKYGPLPSDRNVLRAQGQALQDEFAAFLRAEGYQAIRGQKKQTTEDDWVSPEAFGADVDRKIARADRMVAAEYHDKIEGRLATQEQELAARGDELVKGLENAWRAGEDIKGTAVEKGRQMIASATAEADAIRRSAEEDARKARLDTAERAERDAQAVRDAARLEAAAIRSAAEAEADTLRARAKRRLEAVRRLGRIMKARFDHLVREGVLKATKTREAELSETERRLDERRTHVDAAERAAAKAQADAERAMANVELDGKQMALLGRALHDGELALKADLSDRGFSMNEASMDTTEQIAYRSAWSGRVHDFAATMVRSAVKWRKNQDMAVIRAAARERKLDKREAELDKRGSAIDGILARAQRFLTDWDAVPEASRSPAIQGTLSSAGIFNQAVGLQRLGVTNAKGSERDEGDEAIDRNNDGFER
ncbi:hypothetical protein DFR49_2957 [Hephaestia caeni]|uniref:Plasmid recombination enzyme n=1 Tax=Hephaestia caeni TaxID=645617 RepID=A0A397NHR8_9SPHN|nr:hypothetical protein [Hephaestia caeni]RIA37082.1 hypothetical protein DFR49_2957 [Hephaestia caeni]